MGCFAKLLKDLYFHALQKDKAITLNSVELKIVRTQAKTPRDSFPFG